MDDLKFTLDNDIVSVDGDIVLSDDEIELSKPKNKPKFKSKPRFVPKQMPKKPVVQVQRQQTQHVPQVFHDKTFESFSNPQKRMPEMQNVDDDDIQSNAMSDDAESAGYGNNFPDQDQDQDQNGD